ncbi:MAG: Fe-S cluster assembly ATPase SufC [Alphaproteobacteria bacterium]|nr:MAG: Fe-S cluster assembly ATPase SufC [Alphaproteobacteria bacterium]
MLEIQGLHAELDGKQVLKGLDLTIKAGEVHAIMGPNGTGKSTLSHLLAGRMGYVAQQGSVMFHGEDLLAMATYERARAGLFLAFQYPVEIAGVTTMNFLKSALNAVRTHRGLEPLDAPSFLKLVREKARAVQMDDAMLKRGVNQGFSGGEKKRLEMLQMLLLEPSLAILDEPDSGLDVDALRVVADAINSQREAKRSFLIITHYQRLLDYVTPDVVHIMNNGRIVQSGGAELAQQLEREGYQSFGIAEAA